MAIVPLIKSAEVQQELRRIIDESITPGELHEDRLDRELKSWPGIKSMDGVEALYDLFERSKDGKEITACYFIQERLEVPAEQVAGFLLTRAQENMEDVPLLEKDIRFLGTHTDDPRVSKFLATLLNDERRSYEKRGEDLIGSIPRVCDSAHGELLGWLQKKGLIKRGDPGWAWDPVFEPDRDQQIREIKPLLVKA